jgi:hypothetical protein
VSINRDLFGQSVRAGVRRWLPVFTESPVVRRWLPVIANSPVPRRPLLIATALTAAAAVAAGGSTPAPAPAHADRVATVPAAGAGSGSTASAAPAGKITAARAKAARAKVSAPSEGELMPHGTPGGQSAFTPSREQVRNAKQIVRTGERLKMPPRAQVIAVATALQESKLENLGHLGARNDHDSLGLFQQRPSSGWGSPEQVTNPDYAAEQFYRGLAQVSGYQDMPLSAAAQTVQVSAFPDAYAQWEKMAADLVLAAHGAGRHAGR